MLSWFGGEDDVGILINKKRYAKAAKVLQQQLNERPEDVHLRQRLADVLVLDGKSNAALQILGQMVDEFAEEGFDAKAIAVLKKMQRIDPGRDEIEQKLAGLIKRRDRDVWQRIGAVAVQIDSGEEPEHQELKRADAAMPTVKTSPLFSTFSGQELLAVIRGLSLLNFEPGEIIVSESEPGDSLFVLATGSVRVYVRNAENRNKEVRLLEQGSFFGEISLLSGNPRTATITAATPVEILQLDRRTLDSIAAQHPHVPQIIREFYEKRAMSPEEVRARGGAVSS
ncbi:MAG: cyclic nucleotide-binding domain-containing protein [bacterium]|nr:cyclic nucleotide-binding domain-containing protein [bacterium]